MGMPAHGRHLPAFVLLMVVLHGPLHGRAVATLLRRSLPGGSTADDPAVYRCLRDLETAGLVTSEWVPGPGGPARHVYRATDRAPARLAEWAEEIARSRRNLDYFLDSWAAWNRTGSAAPGRSG
ncbi:PadR domain-containing protein [Candidatus Hydrogenisulfobacillus filiaventi]|uniref:PadR domain-containing protein n=1 Tax=Candidatus Hydrogenisulfobacillus filiaventi TaxID=2707344 RepID=A0A6F8ZDG5_9FIRM|nr:PadR family transcriptional regulator [Bacillota bacterium]CAB1127649.1 PadR domain-containing protein [Candidatus Hydrogenisulfobacillus filiaventi]